jgi:proteasome lid subunit RPN8/RPN11
MRFLIFGRRRHRPESESTLIGPDSGVALATTRVAAVGAQRARSVGRRDVDFAYDRVFIPSLLLDHTELTLRQAGIHGDEGFAVWAGTLAGGDAHVATLVTPRRTGEPTHGEISSDTTANVLSALDQRDLVPILQLHTHPHQAFLSSEDAIRPLVALPGFISVVIPNFGFIDLADVALWSAHEYVGFSRWREVEDGEKQRRFIIDDSLIWAD